MVTQHYEVKKNSSLNEIKIQNILQEIRQHKENENNISDNISTQLTRDNEIQT